MKNKKDNKNKGIQKTQYVFSENNRVFIKKHIKNSFPHADNDDRKEWFPVHFKWKSP